MDRRWGDLTACGALVLAVAVGVVLLLAPLATQSTIYMKRGSESTFIRTEHVSLLRHEGSGIALQVAVAVVLALAVYLLRERRDRLAAAGLLVVGSLTAVESLGKYFLPVAVVAVFAGLRTPDTSGNEPSSRDHE